MDDMAKQFAFDAITSKWRDLGSSQSDWSGVMTSPAEWNGVVGSLADIPTLTASNMADTTLPVFNRKEKTTESIELKDFLPQMASILYEKATDYVSQNYNSELLLLTNEIKELNLKIDAIGKTINNNSHAVLNSTISTLPSEEYTLLKSVDIILKIYEDEAIAIIPELEIFGEGATEMEAVKDLKLEMLDLFDDLNEMEDDELGDDPKAWKKIINQLVEKCQ